MAWDSEIWGDRPATLADWSCRAGPRVRTFISMVGGVRGLKQHAFHPGNGYCGAVCPEVEYSPLTQSLGSRTWLIALLSRRTIVEASKAVAVAMRRVARPDSFRQQNRCDPEWRRSPPCPWLRPRSALPSPPECKRWRLWHRLVKSTSFF